jgi:hypothetical protein
MATVSTKLTLDTSGFNRGIKSAESGMSKFKAAAGPAVLGAIAAGLAAAAAAAAGLAVGVKGALDLGGALSDLSTRTGVAAGELRVLQEAFARNGLAAEQVGPAINKLQRAIVEGGQGVTTYKRAFDSLGISLDDLRGMSSAEQFQTIGTAINGLTDPAARAATAMQIFGRSGGELLTLFSNSGAMNEAARSVGDQADILTRNANLFDQASDILGSVATKMQGFFVGVADTLVPALMPLLEAADGIDLSGLGQDLGNAIAFGLTVITSGNLGNLLSAQFKLSAAELLNSLYKGFIGITAFLVQRFIDIPGDFLKVMQVVTQPAFWVGLGQALLAAALGFGRAIAMAVADLLGALREIPALAGVLESPLNSIIGAADAAGEAQLGLQNSAAANLKGPVDQLREQALQSFTNAIAAADEAMQGASQLDTGKFQAARDALVNDITTQMEANREAARSRFEATKTQTPLMEGMEGQAGKSNTGIIAQSLQKVGGGAAFARFSDAANPAAQAVREQQKSNVYLETIAAGINYIRSGNGTLMPA